MSHEPSISTVSETLTERASHPVKEFFADAGFDVSSFPSVRFLIEVNAKILVTSQIFFPLRIPGRSGLIYETFARVVRSLEIPSSSIEKKHRRFIEMEWVVEESPVFEAENHAAFGFLAGDVVCPSCRSVFVPEAQILDESTVKINCPSCLHYWTLKVDSPSSRNQTPLLITDEFYKKPSEIRRQIEIWQNSPEQKELNLFEQYFPIEFEAWEQKEEALQIFFDGSSGVRCTSEHPEANIEIIFKTFVNFVALEYFKKHGDKRVGRNLETTEVLRKSQLKTRATAEAPIADVQEKNPSSFTEVTRGGSSISRIEVSGANFRPLYATEPRGSWKMTAISFVISISLVGGLFGYFYFQHLQSLKRAKADELSLSQALASKVDEKANENTGAVIDSTLSYVEPQAAEQESSAEMEVEAIEEFETNEAELLENSDANENIQATSSEEKSEGSDANKIESTESETAATVKQKVEQKTATSKKVESEKVQLPVVKKELPTKLALPVISPTETSFRQGVAFLKAKQFEAAVEEFNEVLRLDKSNVEAFRLLGKSYLHLGQIDNALQSFSQFLETPSKEKDQATMLEVQQVVEQLKQLKLATSTQ